MAAAGIGGGGPNSRPLDDTLAETGPGLADDAVVGGELAPGEIGRGAEAAEEKLKRAGWTKPDAGGSVGGS